MARAYSTGCEISERERIACAFIDLVAAKGYEDTALETVFEVAEVDSDAFERHFADKKDCFLQLFDELVTDFARVVLEAYMGQEAWRDRMRAGAWAALRYLREDRSRTEFFLVEVLNAGEVARAHNDQALQSFVQLVDSGRQELDDPDSMMRSDAEAVVGSIYEMALTQVRHGVLDHCGDFVPQLMHLAVLPYEGPQAAEEELEMALPPDWPPP